MNLKKHNYKLSSGLTLFVMALIWMAANVFLSSTPLFQDFESRWQTFFYDFRITLPKTQKVQHHPIYLIPLDDTALPEKTCRSPISKKWLLDILKAVNGQSPKAVGLNILLKYDSTEVDRKLADTLVEMGNVVILDKAGSFESDPFKRAAKSWGTMSYRTNSAKDIQYVCNDPRFCICIDSEQCENKRIFFREIRKILYPENSSSQKSDKAGWLKIFFSFFPGSTEMSTGGTSWKILSPVDLEKLAPNSLEENALVLIGPSFTGLSPTYQIPIKQLSSSGVPYASGHVSALELSAFVIEMILNGTILSEVPLWMECMLLFMCLLVVAAFSWDRWSFLPFWVGVLICLFWNTVAGLIFAYFLLEINTCVPTLLILTYSMFCVRHMQIQTKLQKLSLENQLEKEHFDNLVDRFHTHSVFNALDHIRYLIRKKEAGAEQYLLDYSTLLLDDLRHSSKRYYPVMEQWEYVINYLKLQNMKLDNTIKVKTCLESNLINRNHEELIVIPWKLFYPLVENAVKYTKPLATIKTGKEAAIRLNLGIENGYLQFQIENSYSKSKEVFRAGQGLINLEKRLRFLYSKNGWILKHSQSDHSWVATLQLSIKESIQTIGKGKSRRFNIFCFKRK